MTSFRNGEKSKRATLDQKSKKIEEVGEYEYLTIIFRKNERWAVTLSEKRETSQYLNKASSILADKKKFKDTSKKQWLYLNI